MAMHHTCDRCGNNCAAGGGLINVTVDLGDWDGDGTLSPRTEVLNVGVSIAQMQHVPDLCHFCQVDVLLASCDALRRKRDAAKDATTPDVINDDL